jgi:hypothetical protein
MEQIKYRHYSAQLIVIMKHSIDYMQKIGIDKIMQDVLFVDGL